ncbi:hypothetical protein [Bradyrhizobium sp. LHD-71]|uniref:hypothetical protein n=1 Tax=Bradyrhizobium sp. LHD-71 TaxID=3072141 RepID=UPI00280F456E|nr:hypothetical protein [Bradyrhizobium sp. LHD-71]MDQ8727508.1 hypothetical protein [Bradyrhizobium sp. LHD-71]
MAENDSLKTKASEALNRYREALAAVERLEREEAFAHQALTELLDHLEIAVVEGHASGVRQDLFQTGQAAVSRLNEVRRNLSEATASLDRAYHALAALDQALGYVPIVATAGPASRHSGNNPQD